MEGTNNEHDGCRELSMSGAVCPDSVHVMTVSKLNPSFY